MLKDSSQLHSTTIGKICEIHSQAPALNHFFLASPIGAVWTFNSDWRFTKTAHGSELATQTDMVRLRRLLKDLMRSRSESDPEIPPRTRNTVHVLLNS